MCVCVFACVRVCVCVVILVTVIQGSTHTWDHFIVTVEDDQNGGNDDVVVYDRFDEGLQDITAASIQMVGEPKEVFKNLLKGHGTTR